MDLSRATERIIRSYSLELVTQEVFQESTGLFVQGLMELSKTGKIQVGGRRIRELLGCKVFDFANVIQWDAETLLDAHQRLRLGPLVKVLEDYPTNRMKPPDLDFFTSNLEPQKVAEKFRPNFRVTTNTASGGACVIDVITPNGVATFIDSDKSFQTKPPWPLYGFVATLKDSSFNLDISQLRMICPLEYRGTGLDEGPTDPVRVATVARILLWSVTATDMEGRPLNVPGDNSQKVIYETVARVFELANLAQNDPKVERMYRGALRDFAIALRIIILSDWNEASRLQGIPSDRVHFLNRVTAAWNEGKFFHLGGGK